MGTTTMFFWLQLGNVIKRYRTVVAITGIVTSIIGYHYVRIFISCTEVFVAVGNKDDDYSITLTGASFNDAYRYVDWLLTGTLFSLC
jgi:hypothetical protein